MRMEDLFCHATPVFVFPSLGSAAGLRRSGVAPDSLLIEESEMETGATPVLLSFPRIVNASSPLKRKYGSTVGTLLARD